MVLFYFKCEKCGVFQEIQDDEPTPESIPHIEYPKEYGDQGPLTNTSIMVPICEECYNRFKREWVNE